MNVGERARSFVLFVEERKLQAQSMTVAEETETAHIAEEMERLLVISAAVPAKIRGIKGRWRLWPALPVDARVHSLFLRVNITMSTSVRNAAISIK